MPRGFAAVVVTAVTLTGCGYEEYDPASESVGEPSGADGSYNCADFASHADAQDYYDGQDGDPDGLDRDGDGSACESLP